MNRLCQALSELGADNMGIAREYLLQPRKKVTWHDVEIFTTMQGLEFDELFQDRVLALLGALKSQSYLEGIWYRRSDLRSTTQNGRPIAMLISRTSRLFRDLMTTWPAN